jgi:predicted PurR-regulated permease PerM
MAEPSTAADKPAVIPEVPTQITATHVIAIILAVAACRSARDVLVPLSVAVLTAIALGPPVRQMSRVLPRWLASAVVVLGIAAAIGFAAWSLSDEVSAFSQRLPTIVREFRSAIQSASPRQSLIRQLQQAVTELERTTAGPKPPTDATPVTIVEPVDVQRQMMSYARSGLTYLSEAVLLFFLVYFLLASGEMFKKKFVRLGGDRLSQRRVTLQMIDEITDQIGRYVFYLFWSGLLVGVVTWAAFSALGVRYAGLWGVAAGLLNCIPYFGPTLIMIASAAAAAVQFQSVSMVLAVGGVSVVITSLEGFLLAPIALGKAAHANSVSIFVAVMFWGWMWGSAGLFLAVPLLMITKTIADHVESLSTVSELLGDGT